jgi:nucleoid-associated protein YgaU
MGMAVLAAIPLVSLVLIRMLWSGSSLWFLTVGIILLGAAAVVFLAHRPQEHEYGRQTLARETSRVPLILTALGVVFLAMLLLPNFSGGDSGPEPAAQQQPGAAVSDVSDVSQPPPQEAPVEEQSEPPPQEAAPEGGQTHVVQSGDNLWDIAQRFGVTVEAIVEANELANPTDLDIDQVLIIPPAEEEEQPEE